MLLLTTANKYKEKYIISEDDIILAKVFEDRSTNTFDLEISYRNGKEISISGYETLEDAEHDLDFIWDQMGAF